VIKPRIGGGFGGKQEMLIEDLCAHLTMATGRPVRFEYTREQEFTSARSRHPQILRFRAAWTNDGKLTGMEMYIMADTGAYGTHGLTVQMVSGFRALSTYWPPTAASSATWSIPTSPTRRVPRLWRAAGPLRPGAAHGRDRAALGWTRVEFKRSTGSKWVRRCPWPWRWAKAVRASPQT
jgi:hypothetical protein